MERRERMADLDKILKALEICGAMQYTERGVTCPTGCPYYEKISCQAYLLEDAHELLKELTK